MATLLPQNKYYSVAPSDDNDCDDNLQCDILIWVFTNCKFKILVKIFVFTI